MKVLVTGGDGFIGSHLVEALIARGHEVTAFVMYNSFNSWGWLDHLSPANASRVTIQAGDIRDASGVREAMRGQEAVLHLAALIAIPYSYRCPDSYLETNVRGTLNVLQAARDLGTRQIITTSTSEVYGTARTVPITEAHPLQAQSPYAASKIGADQMALSFHHAYGLPVTVLRPFNTYGPRQSARAVIPTVIAQRASGSRTLHLGALTPTRDFTYVADTAAGFVALLEAGGAPGEVLNLGNGKEISIGDLAALIASLMGVEVDIRSEEDRTRPAGSEVERLLASADKLRALTTWTPRHSLRQGLQETIAWFRDPVHLSAYKAGIYNV